MTFEMILVLCVLGGVIVVLAGEWLSADATLMAALAVVIAGGVIDLQQALHGFANTTLLALGSLYIVAEALRQTGVLAAAGQFVLGRVRDLRVVLARMAVTVSTGSAFLNNTPIVAMGIPAVRSWSAKHEVPASKLLMPLSFASIFGGLCTLMGTSTNLVTDGLLRSHDYAGFGFFELAIVGLPCAVVGWIYLVVLAPALLPTDRPQRQTDDGAADDEQPRAEAAAESEPGSPVEIWLSVGVLVGVVALAAGHLVHISMAALLGATVVIATGTISPSEAREAIDWSVLIVIGAALGLGRAMEASGTARWFGEGIVELGADVGGIGLLTAVVVGTSILTQVITNNGAVALFFPIVVTIAETRGLPLRPLVIGMTAAGSLSFATPIGYQTNMMVHAAGDYRFADFARVGIPLQLVLLVVTVATLSFVWSLGP